MWLKKWNEEITQIVQKYHLLKMPHVNLLPFSRMSAWFLWVNTSKMHGVIDSEEKAAHSSHSCEPASFICCWGGWEKWLKTLAVRSWHFQPILYARWSLLYVPWERLTSSITFNCCYRHSPCDTSIHLSLIGFWPVQSLIPSETFPLWPFIKWMFVWGYFSWSKLLWSAII